MNPIGSPTIITMDEIQELDGLVGDR
jgi:hypothetical protein